MERGSEDLIRGGVSAPYVYVIMQQLEFFPAIETNQKTALSDNGAKRKPQAYLALVILNL